jgi:small ligand-binding sensory domain FIST
LARGDFIMSQLRFAAALSTHTDLSAALEEVCAAADSLGGSVDLAMVFVSPDRADQCQQIADTLCQRLKTERLLGCTAESLVGTGREVEGETGISLWVAHLPGVTLTPMHLQYEKTPDGSIITGWPDGYEAPWPEGMSVLCLGDPFSFPAELMLEQLNEDRPGVPVLGGMASGGASPGENRLILGRQVFDNGALACLVSGNVRVRTVLSQGCRPIGKPFIITKAEGNVIQELGGRPALLALKEIFDALPNRERELVQSALHLGRVLSEYRDHFEPGDFLVRNVIGHDPQSGAIAVGDYFRVGQTVQFHIRDGKTADDDLKQHLAAVKTNKAAKPLGGLLFTCNGRGQRLFGEPHHDAGLVQQYLGDIPLAGFFAQGELGPVAQKNFMHGFTASLALFEAVE